MKKCKVCDLRVTSLLFFPPIRLKVWEPFNRTIQSICGYENLRVEASSTLCLTEKGTKAVLLSGINRKHSVISVQYSEECVVIFTLWC